MHGILFYHSTTERLHRSVESLLLIVLGLGPHSQCLAGELGERTTWVRELLDQARRVPEMERVLHRIAGAADGRSRPRDCAVAVVPRPHIDHRQCAQAPSWLCR